MNTFIFGGSGYIGNVVSNKLSRFTNITNLDNQIYNNQYYPYFELPNYRELILDIRKFTEFKTSFQDIDTLLVLGGLVGDPITKKYPDESIQINEESIIRMLDQAINSKIKNIIFISTCSNYGLMRKGQIADENTNLNPLSLYAKSKVKIENLLSQSFNNHTNITILRFATAFGVSPRMRFDLTINQFVKEAFLDGFIEVYDADTNRPYCHVKDFAEIISMIIKTKDRDAIKNQIFNVGRDENNSSKKDLIKIIKSVYQDFDYKLVENDVDKRDYIVNFKKIRDHLNFVPNYSIKYGVLEIIDYIKNNKSLLQDKTLFGNYELKR